MDIRPTAHHDTPRYTGTLQSQGIILTNRANSGPLVLILDERTKLRLDDLFSKLVFANLDSVEERYDEDLHTRIRT